MKLSAVSRMTKPAFKGYEYKKDDYGDDCYHFNFPHDNRVQINEPELEKKLKNGQITQEEYTNQKKKLHERYQTCDVVLYKLGKDGEPLEGTAKRVRIEPNGTAVNLANYGFAPDEDFAYNYEINTYTGDGTNDRKLEAQFNRNHDRVGIIRNFSNATVNIVNRNAIKPTNNGNGYLAMVDNFAPGYYYAGFDSENVDDIGKVLYDPQRQKDAESARRTFGIQYGGSLAGYKQKLDYLSDMGVKVFFSTPITGGDSVSYHKYWNCNDFQLAGGVGDMNNFEDFVEDLFSHGMSFVLDVPLTSEGLKGVHFQYATKWADFDTPFKHWFRMDGIDTDLIGYGLIGARSDNASHYLVNSPQIFTQLEDGQIKIEDNPEYDSLKPTEIQYFDKRFVSDELKNSKQLITRYDVMTVENPLAVATHDDTIAPYSFRLSKNDYITYVNNVKKLSDFNKDKPAEERMTLDSKDGTVYVSHLTHTKVTPKKEAGIGLWDANTDMVKRRYFESAADYKSSSDVPVDSRGYTPFNNQVQDAAFQVGDFWGKTFVRIQNRFAAQKIGAVNSPEEAQAKIRALIDSKVFPEEAELRLEALQNIDAGLYNLDLPEIGAAPFITKMIMSVPFENLELDPYTLGVLATPMFTNRPIDSETTGLSRYELAQKGNPQFSEYMEGRFPGYKAVYEQVNGMLSSEVFDFTMAVLRAVDENQPEGNKIFADAQGTVLTEYGYHVVKTVGPDISKFALMKAFLPNMRTRVNSKGQILYDTSETRANSSLEQLGVIGHTPLYEGKLLAGVMKNGLRKVASDSSAIMTATEAVHNVIKDTNVNSFRYAEAVVKVAGKTLDTRVDALKDYADIDSVRNEKDDKVKVMEDLTYFWKKYKDIVYNNSPSAKIWGEITDTDLMGSESELINKTELSSVAGYGQFFSTITEALAGKADKDVKNLSSISKYAGGQSNASIGSVMTNLKNLLDSSYPLEYMRTVFNFGGNHDKPRLSYLFAVDLQMCHAILHRLAPGDTHYNLALSMITGGVGVEGLPFDVQYNYYNKNYINNNYFLGANTYAIANGDAIRSALSGALFEKHLITEDQLTALHEAVTALVNGNNTIAAEKRPSYLNYDTALSEILDIAETKGLKLAKNDNLDVRKSLIKMIQKEGKNMWDLEHKRMHSFDNPTYTDPTIPAQIRLLCDIIKAKVNEKASSIPELCVKGQYKNEVMQKIDAAIQDYMKRYSQEYINEELRRHQTYLTERTDDERSCFGCTDMRRAIQLVFDKANCFTDNEAKKKAMFELFKYIDEPAIQKVLMSTRLQMSLPGIPVMYGGDEHLMGGYEEKSKNLTHANRDALPWSQYEGDSEEAKYYREQLEKFQSVLKVRETAPVLSHGIPHILANSPCPGVISMGSDGAAAVSLFNWEGISPAPKAEYGIDSNNKHKPGVKQIAFDAIPLEEVIDNKAVAIPLAAGTILYNVLKKSEKYIVEEVMGNYSIKPLKAGEKVIINGSSAPYNVLTLVTEAAKKAKPFFKGGSKSYSVPRYNIVSNPHYFVEKQAEECGSKLSLIAR